MDVEKVIAAGATVTCNNGAKATSASFVVVDGKLCLAVTFPATADEAEDSDSPDDPDDDSDDNDDESDDTGNDDETGGNEDQSGNQSTPTDSPAKPKSPTQGMPATGDAGFDGLGALLAAAVVCLGSAGLVRRRQR